MGKLKKCPFCGCPSKDDDIYYGSMLGDTYSEGDNVYSIQCDCGAYMWAEKKEELVEKWNKRA